MQIIESAFPCIGFREAARKAGFGKNLYRYSFGIIRFCDMIVRVVATLTLLYVKTFLLIIKV
jgi:hypothetical protein